MFQRGLERNLEKLTLKMSKERARMARCKPNIIALAAVGRTYVEDRETKNLFNQIVHANDRKGSKYWDPANNPFQGPQDKTYEAKKVLQLDPAAVNKGKTGGYGKRK